MTSILDGLLEPPSARALSGWERLKAKLSGMDCDLLERCPDRDLQEMTRCCGLLLLVAAYQCAVFASLGHILLANPGSFHPEYVAIAALPAVLVMVLEAALVIAPSYFSAGVRNLEQSGLVVPSQITRRLKNALAITLRLIFALALAQLGSIAITLPLLSKDAFARFEQNYRQRNATLFVQADARFADTQRRLTEQLDEARSQAATLKKEEERWRRASINPDSDDPELSALLARLEELRSAKADAEKDVALQQQLANDELMGKRTNPILSGNVGYGPFRRAADERVANAERRVENVMRDLRDTEGRVAALRAQLAGASAGKAGGAETRLAEVTRDRAAQEARVAELDGQARGLVRDREKIIRASVESDTTHVPKEDGILARAHAVRDLIESDWSALLVVILFDIVLFFIEVAVLLSKTLAAPTTYATLLAYAHVVGNHQIVQEIAKTLNGREPAVADASSGADEPLVPKAAPGSFVPDAGPADGDTASARDETAGDAGPVKRGRGRPPGSPNRPKTAGDRPDLTLVPTTGSDPYPPEPRR